MPDNSLVQFAIAVGSPGAVGCLGWWLSGRFRAIEVAYKDSLDAHEVKDQSRHEENLDRFNKINIALTRMGYKNGI